MADSHLEAHIPGLRRYARALCGGDVSMADDLVQDCLERALSRWGHWRRDGDLRFWLFAILRNLWLDGMRRRGRNPPPHSLDDVAEPSTGTPDQTHAMLARDLAWALGHLAPEQKECLLLVGLEGWSYGEVAEMTGVPVGTVMSRLKRGRDRVAQLMQDGEPVLRRVK